MKSGKMGNRQSVYTSSSYQKQSFAGERIAFLHAIIDGLSVLEYEPKGKASIEIQALFQYIVKEFKSDHPTRKPKRISNSGDKT